MARPGVYEVPIGLPLGELLTGAEYAGGVINGKPMTVATSGPSGGFVPARFPLPTDFLEKRFPELLKRQQADKRSRTVMSLAQWYVASYLPRGTSDFDLLTAPLDKEFFDILQSLVGLPIAPLLGAGIVVYAEGTDIMAEAVNFTRSSATNRAGSAYHVESAHKS